MKNLSLYSLVNTRLVGLEGNIVCAAFNNDQDILYIGTDKGSVYLWTPAYNNKLEKMCEITDGSVLDMEYISDSECVCICTVSSVYMYNLSTCMVETVYTSAVQITCISWSPNMDIIVVTLDNNSMKIFDQDFEIIVEQELNKQQMVPELNMINVGWGKKETQFHGKSSKVSLEAAAADVNAVSDLDDGDDSVGMSWRGDGTQFVLSSRWSGEEGDEGRYVSVWSRDGILYSINEALDTGVSLRGSCVAWRPSGEIIATGTGCRDNSYHVTLLESNGLTHYDFPLSSSEDNMKCRVKQMVWNINSDVLAIHLIQTRTDPHDGRVEEEEECCQLWSRSNYHWYMKQEVVAGSGESVVVMMWDVERAHTLHLILSGTTGTGGTATYRQYHFGWLINTSRGNTSHDLATVGVIDGRKVLLTSFRHTVVPPPYASSTVTLSRSTVRQLIFAPSADSDHVSTNMLAVWTSSCKMAVICLDPKVKGGVGVVSVVDVKVSSSGELPLLHHFLWVSHRTMLAVLTTTHHSSTIVHFTITCACAMTSAGGDDPVGGCTGPTSIVESHRVECTVGVVWMMCSDSVGGTVLVHCTDGTVHRFTPHHNPATTTLVPWQEITCTTAALRYPGMCSHVQLARFNNGADLLPVALTQHYRLFVGGVELSNNCNSFTVHSHFLLFTTHTHKLHCVSLSDPLQELHPADNAVSLKQVLETNSRNVERGSHLVTSVSDGIAVMLQMPRGNLEVVCPRALTLRMVRAYLQRLRYAAAFHLMNTHQIDMNLMYDHNPQQFIDNASLFVQQLNDSAYIDKFLLALRNEDVCKSIYISPGSVSEPQQGDKVLLTIEGGKDKVDTICDRLSATIKESGNKSLIFSLLMCYAKKTHPELELALALILDMRNHAEQYYGNDVGKAMKYLLRYVDVTQLYRIALGTYDFQLALLVAEHSHMDPKEYLPALNKLYAMPDTYRKYTIDKDLKRYSKALQHLSECGDEYNEECVEFIKEHRLYQEGLSLYNEGSDVYNRICSAYADYMMKHKEYSSAALVYLECGDNKLAMSAYERALDWQMVFSLAAKLQLSAADIRQLVASLSSRLVQQGKHLAAARCLIEYGDDYEQAVVTLIDGSEWKEALRLIHKHNREDFIESHLKHKLLDQYDSITTRIETLSQQFNTHSTRLTVVRAEKSSKLVTDSLADDDGEYVDVGVKAKESDLYSDTSSVTGISSSQASTLNTRSTGRSSKNRRKAEKKMLSLKEGNPFEEHALVKALQDIVATIDVMQEEIASLIETLAMFGWKEKASNLQALFAALFTLVESGMSSIWTSSPANTTSSTQGSADCTTNELIDIIRQKTIEPADIILSSMPELRKTVKWKLPFIR